ncbi:MAG: hypothetical protein PHC64_08945 [Candidatus Gastranaerophilales bacterium]|nr:hypothetical protein [Candidatus Gastranaerophilales bacterium]
MILNFLLLFLFSPRFFDVTLFIRKVTTALIIYARHIPHILSETAGIPAYNGAEITMSLCILGIVAMNTIPACVAEQAKNSIIIALKRDYSIYSSGINLAIHENGTPNDWVTNTTSDPTGLSSINALLYKYFKMAQNCGFGPGCFPDVKYKNLKGVQNDTNLNQDPNYTKFRLIDGTSVAVTQWNSNCDVDWGESFQLKNVCGLMLMDVNGDKAPNTYGMDFFGFAFTKYGLVPLGSPLQQKGYPFSGFCNTDSNANFKYENGLSCTAWVLYNDNMDYLDCKGLNWNNGKTTCSDKSNGNNGNSNNGQGKVKDK